MIAAVSADVDGRLAVAGLAAAAEVPVAAVVLDGIVRDDDPIRDHATGLLEGAGELGLGRAMAVIGALGRAYDLVLVSGGAGLLVPVGPEGWTLVDLAVGLRAPVVIVTGPGADAAGHTMLALDALDGRGLTGAVVTIGEVELPVPVAGRIPATALNGEPAEESSVEISPETEPVAKPAPAGEAAGETAPLADDAAEAADVDRSEATADPDGEVARVATADPDGEAARATASGAATTESVTGGTAEAAIAEGQPEKPAAAGGRLAGAAGWFEPMLRATAETGPDPVEAPGGAPRAKPVDGRRFVVMLAGVFLIMVLLACGLAFCGADTYSVATMERQTPDRTYSARVSVHIVPRPTVPPRRSTDVCPEFRGPLTPIRPGSAATVRVDTAWRRIERWLGRNAPKSAGSLRGPAPVPKIDDLQRRMSVTFSPDLVASLRRHDGVTGMGGFALPAGYKPMSLTEIFADWQGNCRVVAGFSGGSGGENSWWNREYVPFAMDGTGGDLITDQRPGGHGRIGATDPETGANFADWPASVADLLEQTATALETGRPFRGHYRHKVEDGSLSWDYVPR